MVTLDPTKDPERLSRCCRAHIERVHVLMKLELLIEAQQARGQVGELQLREGPREVEDAVVLSVAVFIEIPVGIVEQDRLRIGSLDFRPLCGGDGLLQSRRIFEDETLLRQACALLLNQPRSSWLPIPRWASSTRSRFWSPRLRVAMTFGPVGVAKLGDLGIVHLRRPFLPEDSRSPLSSTRRDATMLLPFISRACWRESPARSG